MKFLSRHGAFILIVLLVRPAGLFGKPEVKKV